MPASCAVADCGNAKRAKELRGSSLVFHAFPKDAAVRRAWITKCRRRDKFNANNSAVCSDHFTTDDYIRDLRNELLGLPERKLLKPGAVPSVFPSRKGSKPTSESQRAIRARKREITSLVNDILNNAWPRASDTSNGAVSTNVKVALTTELDTEPLEQHLAKSEVKCEINRNRDDDFIIVTSVLVPEATEQHLAESEVKHESDIDQHDDFIAPSSGLVSELMEQHLAESDLKHESDLNHDDGAIKLTSPPDQPCRFCGNMDHITWQCSEYAEYRSVADSEKRDATIPGWNWPDVGIHKIMGLHAGPVIQLFEQRYFRNEPLTKEEILILFACLQHEKVCWNCGAAGHKPGETSEDTSKLCWSLPISTVDEELARRQYFTNSILRLRNTVRLENLREEAMYASVRFRSCQKEDHRFHSHQRRGQQDPCDRGNLHKIPMLQK